MQKNKDEKTITLTGEEIAKLLIPIAMCVEVIKTLQMTYEFLDAGLMEIEDVVTKIQDTLGYKREEDEEEVVEKEED